MKLISIYSNCYFVVSFRIRTIPASRRTKTFEIWLQLFRTECLTGLDMLCILLRNNHLSIRLYCPTAGYRPTPSKPSHRYYNVIGLNHHAWLIRIGDHKHVLYIFLALLGDWTRDLKVWPTTHCAIEAIIWYILSTSLLNL